ncbi:hypothetical protein [Kaistella yonginensis]|uniref:hypothetical protein n=1 Tax=Kaistella yonginensis TaxID=658267 RepID=UPI0025B397A6|nr:hypothetical protein [Kaistella yonginensis]MDN3607340.1 hypothetical protein [Kaistella yonginensis]
MKLKGAEKQFWWSFRNINNSKDIPEELSGYTSIESENDDLHMTFLVQRIKVIHSIYLKETSLTDEGVQWIGQIQQLQSLTLMKHPNITTKSLPHLNKLVDLEYLDLWRTNILLEDLHQLDQLKKLKELYISPTARDQNNNYPNVENDQILEKIIALQEIFPHCVFYVDCIKY